MKNGYKELYSELGIDRGAIKLDCKKTIIILKNDILNENLCLKLIRSLNFLIKINFKALIKIKIKIDISPIDSFLVLLENILYNYMINYSNELKIDFEIKKIENFGKILFDNSLLGQSQKSGEFDKKYFINNYLKSEHGISNHLRLFIKNDTSNENYELVSKAASDVMSILKFYLLDQQYIFNLTSVISEIVDNAISHTNSNVVLSLNIMNVINSENSEIKKLLSVSVCNFSELFLGKQLNDDYENKELNEDVNKIIKIAYDNNIEKYKENYDTSTFFFISTFQKNVTTRKSSGGTGLTVLIKKLIENSIYDWCFVYSGNKKLELNEKYLKLNQDSTIGFNQKNDYFNDIVSDEIFELLEFNLNATLFNLMFIL